MSEATATIRMPMFYITSRRPHESTSSRPMQEFYMWYKSKSAVFIRWVMCNSALSYFLDRASQLWKKAAKDLRSSSVLVCNTSRTILTSDAGGRLYVIAIYFALILAVVTTFFAINCYMNLSARLAPDSPYYSSALVSFMSQNIFATYTTCWVVIVLLFVIFFYVCV